MTTTKHRVSQRRPSATKLAQMKAMQAADKVTCPACGQGPGLACLTMNNVIAATPHRARIQQSWETAAGK